VCLFCWMSFCLSLCKNVPYLSSVCCLCVCHDVCCLCVCHCCLLFVCLSCFPPLCLPILYLCKNARISVSLSYYMAVFLSVTASAVLYIRLYFCLPLCLFARLYSCLSICGVYSVFCLVSALLSDDVFLSVIYNNMNIFHIYS
jgi:hypothetical protein